MEGAWLDRSALRHRPRSRVNATGGRIRSVQESTIQTAWMLSYVWHAPPWHSPPICMALTTNPRPQNKDDPRVSAAAGGQMTPYGGWSANSSWASEPARSGFPSVAGSNTFPEKVCHVRAEAKERTIVAARRFRPLGMASPWRSPPVDGRTSVGSVEDCIAGVAE